MPPEPDVAAHRPPLDPGTEVEVRIGLDRSWSRGFVVEYADETGYVLRRRSDDTVLPQSMPVDAVRKERHNPMWWI